MAEETITREIITYIVPDIIGDLDSYCGDIRALIGSDISSFYKKFETPADASMYFEVPVSSITGVADIWRQIGSKLEMNHNVSQFGLYDDMDFVCSEDDASMFLPASSLKFISDDLDKNKLYINCELHGYFDCNMNKRIVFMYKEKDKDLPVYYQSLSAWTKTSTLPKNTYSNANIQKDCASLHLNADVKKYKTVIDALSKMTATDYRIFSSLNMVKRDYEHRLNETSSQKLKDYIKNQISAIDDTLVDYIMLISMES